MLRLDRVIKPWKESAALNAHVNLYGFWNDTTFLTKSGDVGMVLRVTGVDYESLDRSEQEYAVKRLESALKAFGPGFHVYQYLFKSNRPEIPFAKYDDPVVDAAIDQRRKLFEAKRDHLYEIEIFYCILLEHRDNRGSNTHPVRDRRKPSASTCDSRQWALHHDGRSGHNQDAYHSFCGLGFLQSPRSMQSVLPRRSS
jgi:type IV secretion system protein VirB4